jgi:hypothetical protein
MTVKTKKSNMAALMILCLDEGDDNMVPALVSVSNRTRRRNIFNTLRFTFDRHV